MKIKYNLLMRTNKVALVIILFSIICINSYTQDNEQIYALISHKIIDNYIYIEIGIHNRTQQTIYVMKNYFIENLAIDNNRLVLLIKSSWLSSIVGFGDKGNIEWVSPSINHNPTMIEIRENQMGYLALLLRLPDNYTHLENNNILYEIIGIKYSMEENVTANNIIFRSIWHHYNYILNKIQTFNFRYTNIFGGINYQLFN